MESVSWKDEIIAVLMEYKGVAHLTSIANRIKERGNIPLRGNYEATIRGVLEKNSSDSAIFRGNDLFFSVYGVERRKGVWGLRNI